MKKSYYRRFYSYLFISDKMLRTLKFAAFFIIISTFSILATNTLSQNMKVDLNVKNMTIKDVLLEIRKQTNVSFLYNNDELNDNKRVTFNAQNNSVEEILNILFKNQDLAYSIENNVILIYKPEKEIVLGDHPQQAKQQITGTVKDEMGEPVIGANIKEKGTMNGVVTDIDGHFTISVSPNAVLQVSYIGYTSLEVPVRNQSSISVILKEDSQALDEVVVVGYGTMKRSSVTGSTSPIEAEKLAGFPSVNVVDAMQGRAAGVFITPSRQPGEDPQIRIRGSRSLKAGNSPLLIVDGMPGSWDNLSSEDIASMEILKDAAATAIYGSRAANGVILVTTKSSKSGGKLSIDVNSYVGLNKYNFIDLQSPEKYNAMIRDVMRYQTHGLDKEAWENSDIDLRKGLEMFNSLWADNYFNKGITYDWQDALFNSTSFNTGHNISIGQSTEKIAYQLSYSFQDDNSYYKTQNYQRHILNSNVRLNVTKWMDAGLITRLSLRKSGGWPDNMWDNLRRMTPYETPYIDEDPSKGLKDTVGKEKFVNALWNYEKGYFVYDRKNKMADVLLNVNIKPFSWLTVTTNLKLDFKEKDEGIYYDSRSSKQNLGNNFASYEKTSDSGYTWNGIINVNKTFQDHKIMATAVMEAIESKSERLKASSQDIPASYMDYHFLQAGIVNRNIESEYIKNRLLSYMFRVQYEYKSKYLLNIAMRADGSSRLADGNQWKNFPSAAIAWVVSEEKFLEGNNILSRLKLRLSYGQIGNQAIDSYQTMTRLKSKTYSWAGTGFYTWQPDGLANKSLGWEVSKTWNAGVDFGFLNHKINGTIEYYNTRNEDLLMQRQLPETTGFGTIWQNIGTTENQGVEVTLNAFPVHTKDWNWAITGTFSRNYNKIVELLDGKDDRGSSWFIGQPIGVYWDYQKEGIWQLDEADRAKIYKQEPGQIKVKDVDNDEKITENDKLILGQKEPKFIGSIQSSLQYRDWDFSFNLMGQFGHMIEAGNYIAEWNADKFVVDAIDWWTPLNPTNKWPRAQTAQSNIYESTLKHFTGDFIKVQDISLGYDFTRLLSPYWNVNKLRLYFQARNPFYVYKACPSDINPEQPNSVFTLPSSYVFGINLSF